MIRNIDDENIVRDGQMVRVPMFMMDSVQRAVAAAAAGPNVRNAKGYAVRADAEKQMVSDALADRDRRLVGAWKSPDGDIPAVPAANRPDGALSASAAVAARDAAFAERLEQQRNAWKGGA